MRFLCVIAGEEDIRAALPFCPERYSSCNDHDTNIQSRISEKFQIVMSFGSVCDGVYQSL